MAKRVVMLIALAGVFAGGIACFGLFSPPSDRPEGTTIAECAGLSGEAKADCERRHAR